MTMRDIADNWAGNEPNARLHLRVSGPGSPGDVALEARSKHEGRRLDDARQRQHIDPCRPCPLQHPRAGFDSGTGRDHVVNEDDSAILNRIGPCGIDLESPLHIAAPLIPGQPHLGRCSLRAQQHERIPGSARESMKLP